MATIPSNKVADAAKLMNDIQASEQRITALLGEDPKAEFTVSRQNPDSTRTQVYVLTAGELLAVERERRLVLVERLKEMGIEVGQ